MKRPSAATLWRLAWILIVFACSDVLLTTVGILFFGGEEGNPLIVALAHWIRVGGFDERVVISVWLSKLSVMLGIILAVHLAVKSKPARDDRLMLVGLVLALLVYAGVIASWVWFFILVAT